MPSISEWWVLVISAKRFSCRPSISHISHSGLERSSCWEKIRAVSSWSCSQLPGAGSAVWRMWYSRLKLGSSTHTRAAAVQRGVGELVPVARDEVQPPPDLFEELLHARRRSLDIRVSPPMCMCDTGPS